MNWSVYQIKLRVYNTIIFFLYRRCWEHSYSSSCTLLQKKVLFFLYWNYKELYIKGRLHDLEIWYVLRDICTQCMCYIKYWSKPLKVLLDIGTWQYSKIQKVFNNSFIVKRFRNMFLTISILLIMVINGIFKLISSF